MVGGRAKPRHRWGSSGSDSGGNSARDGGRRGLPAAAGLGFVSSCLRSHVIFSETRMVRNRPTENGGQEDLEAEMGSSTDSPSTSQHLPAHPSKEAQGSSKVAMKGLL